VFTPHARGSTLTGMPSRLAMLVYPACAGIDLVKAGSSSVKCCLPRMRGDRPGVIQLLPTLTMFTPHARGLTQVCPAQSGCLLVYPACAGIDRFATFLTNG